MTVKNKASAVAALGVAAALMLTGCTAGGTAAGGGTAAKEKIFLSLSYSGNNWQDEAANLAMAVAQSPEVAAKYDVKKIISGNDVQKQISDLQSMIASGAKLIVMYPISPTALNPVIKQGCDAGVTMVAYDGTVTEPCAWNLTQLTAPRAGKPDLTYFGSQTAQALVDLLGGKGKIMLNRGVAGTSTDTLNYNTAMAVFNQHPDIKVISEYYGNWDSSVSQQETAKALTAHPDVDGIWSQLGEDGVIKALQAVNMKIPVVGEDTNFLRKMLAKGWPGVSSGSPPAQGGVAMKIGLKILADGAKSVPKNMEMPLPWVSGDMAKVCPGTEFVDNCNFFADAPDSFVTEIFEKQLLPESSYLAATTNMAFPKLTALPDLSSYEQPGERRILTRGVCDSGWTASTTGGLASCKKS